MKIIKVTPRGYCKGVVNALNIVEKTILENPNTKISILGMIVHNKYLSNYFKDKGVNIIENKNKTRLELLDEVDEGIVIFTAHGVSEQVFKKAQEKNLQIVDATCIHVKTTHDLIKSYLKQGYDIIYIGKKNHPEAEGVFNIDQEKIHLIESIKDLDDLKINNNKLMLTNQTTMSILDTQKIIDIVIKMYPSIKICREICNATTLRQQAILNLPDEVDLLLVVGDPLSNNSNKLVEIALNKGINNAYLIETYHDIQEKWLENVQTIAVTSGASTPTQLTNEVIDYLTKITKNS